MACLTIFLMAGMESGLNMSHPHCIPSGLENVEPLLMNDPCAPPRNVYAENVYVTYRSVSYDLDIFQSNSYPALVLHSVRSFRDPSMMYDVNVFSSVLPSYMVSREVLFIWLNFSDAVADNCELIHLRTLESSGEALPVG